MPSSSAPSLGSLFGMTEFSYFSAPSWVDKSKAPGRSSLSGAHGGPVGSWRDWFRGVWNFQFFFFSPNFVWFAVACCVYVLAPYDFEAAKSLAFEDLGWVRNRAIINVGVMMGYFGFWSLSMNAFWFGSRKFNPEKQTTLPRMFHNIWYCTLGALQWTLWEAIFVHCYATGKLDYIPDNAAFATRGNAIRMVVYTMAVPLYREAHFYFTHRFIHFRALYKYVHSLHHRNTDIEPFAGLCMHPVEHLYYFSCVAPSLYFYASPFHMLWNGIHLLISPAASHSGWEDNMQSDLYHYLHHVKFECNYGTSGMPLDRMFGTFRCSLDKSLDVTYKGAAEEEEEETAKKNAPNGAVLRKRNATAVKKKPAAEAPAQNRVYRPKERRWARGGLTSLSLKDAVWSRADQAIYDIFCFCVFAFAAKVAVGSLRVNISGEFVAALVAFGPPLFGLALLRATNDKKSWRWPFHKEELAGPLGFHVALGFVAGPLFTYHTLLALFATPPPMLHI